MNLGGLGGFLREVAGGNTSGHVAGWSSLILSGVGTNPDDFLPESHAVTNRAASGCSGLGFTKLARVKIEGPDIWCACVL